MRRIGFCALVLVGLFYFAHGKTCPEKTRPHGTRCESYYKCTELHNRHVWVPEKCESGLIYEHKLGLCVLPSEDWECNVDAKVGVKKKPVDNKDNADIYIVSNGMEDNDITPQLDGLELIVDANLSREDGENEDGVFESSGDGRESVELEGFMQAEDREGEMDLGMEIKQLNVVQNATKPSTSNIDPKLKAHLQRLSQLIDGLKKSYTQQEPNKPSELRPDQLNAFLAHFNINHNFNSLDPMEHAKIPSTTPASVVSKRNKTLSSVTSSSSSLKPETKVVLLNTPQSYNKGSGGYSNSQIVVNRPEGSVLFTVPSSSSYGNEHHHNYEEDSYSSSHSHNSPKISEETLKTVLELSKQMIASQNVPKLISNPAYYAQPVLQPLYFPAGSYSPHGSSASSPFSSYYSGNNEPNYEHNYSRPAASSSNGYQLSKPFYSKPNRPSSGGNTIIHNNVIPVHLSGDKELLDSYGQSLGYYPPVFGGSSENSGGYNEDKDISINHHHHHHSHKYENNKYLTSVTTVRPIISSTSSSVYGSTAYNTDISITTARPPSYDYQSTASSLVDYYTPSPHLSENNVHNLFTDDKYPTNQLSNLPRPIKDPSNIYQQQRPTPSTAYHNHNQNQLFPQIHPSSIHIRPNSQKIESMEDNSAEMSYDNMPQAVSFNYNNNNNNKLESLGSIAYANEPFGSPNAYMPRPTNSPSYSLNLQSSNSGVNQLVNIGGNFMSYDVFQHTLLPMMSQGSLNSEGLNNLEVISCTAGARQPNNTDCTRYYVCSKKDGKVLSYSCPPYTAFNTQTRICDAQTYAQCNPVAIVSSYTVQENKRIQLEALKALQDAKRRREQAIKAQSLANLLNQYSSGIEQTPHHGILGNIDTSVGNEKDMLNMYVQQSANMASSVVVSTTSKPSSVGGVKKRKYYCKEGDKIADQTSIFSYFVCYKNAQGMMKGHKMTCSKGLLFCPKSSMCTLSSKCS